MSNNLRVGVIGVGHLGQHHARLCAALHDVELVGVLDVNKPRADSIARLYGTQMFGDVLPLLSKVDAVSIAVPTSDHFHVVKQCLAAGVNVLVEKPIACTEKEGNDLVELAQQKRLVLQVGHIERFNPVVESIQRDIHSPFYMEALRMSPFQPRGTDVDVVRDLMIHDLDIALSFGLGSIVEIEAYGMALASPYIDFANARIQFENGCVAAFTASRVSSERLRRLHLLQMDTFMAIDYQSRKSVIRRRVRDKEGAYREIVEERQSSDEEPLQLELKAFIRSIQDGTRPVVSGEDASKCLGVAERIVESILRRNA